MKEIFLETKNEELNFDKNTNEYKESIFNSFFFFRFLNLLIQIIIDFNLFEKIRNNY